MTNLKLKARIIERYGSQSAFAAALRIREPVVSRVVNGYQKLSPEEQNRWSRFLGEGVTKLLGEAAGGTTL